MSAATITRPTVADWHKSEEARALIAAYLAMEPARDALRGTSCGFYTDKLHEVMDSLESDLDDLRDAAVRAAVGEQPDDNGTQEQWDDWADRDADAMRDAPSAIAAIVLTARATLLAEREEG